MSKVYIRAAKSRKRLMRKQRIMGAGCVAAAALCVWIACSMTGMEEMGTAVLLFLFMGIPLLFSRSMIIY